MISMNTSQAAKHLNISEGFLRKLRKNNSGPAFLKLGAKVVYLPEDLEAWIKSCRCTTADSNRQ